MEPEQALEPRRRKFVMGVVGGIGAGKSLVTRSLASCGAFVVSGDALGHEALLQPAIRQRVVERWGTGVVTANGEIDRRRLAAVVFVDPAERRALEELSFPWIERRLQEEIAAAQANPAVRFIVVDAAIMLEAGWSRLCDRLVYVHAPRAVRLRRLAKQRGWTEREVQARESAQMSLTEKVTHADAAVDNSDEMDYLAWQVDQLLKQWRVFS